MTQLSIDDLEGETDHSVNMAAVYADPEWTKEAEAAVSLLCKRGQEFTTDDVWRLLDHSSARTHEPRALGAIIRALSKDGVIEATGLYLKSTRRECHRRPLAVWKPRVKRSELPRKAAYMRHYSDSLSSIE